MHERRQVPIVLRDFPDDAGADVGRLDRRHHEDRLEALRQVAIHQRHLELVLEIADRAQPADVERGADLLCEIHEQPLELGDLYTLLVGRGKTNELNSFVGSE